MQSGNDLRGIEMDAPNHIEVKAANRHIRRRQDDVRHRDDPDQVRHSHVLLVKLYDDMV